MTVETALLIFGIALALSISTLVYILGTYRLVKKEDPFFELEYEDDILLDEEEAAYIANLLYEEDIVI